MSGIWYNPGDFRKVPTIMQKRDRESYGIFEVYGEHQRCCSFCGNMYFTVYIDEPVSLCAQCIE